MSEIEISLCDPLKSMYPEREVTSEERMANIELLLTSIESELLVIKTELSEIKEKKVSDAE